jgi:microcystin-dependent protein
VGLETANYVADLVTTNPLTGDLKNQGDDHIRMIKSVLQNTFPGLGGRFQRVATKSSAYTVVLTDFSVMLDCTAALTLSFTAATTLGNGFCIAVYAAGGAVTLDPAGTEQINGALTYTLPQGCFGLVFCDGSGFLIMSNYTPLAQLERTGTAGQVLTSTGASTAPSMQTLPVTRPPGEVAVFAMNSAPAGWLCCNGSAVNRTTYANLFAAIGTTYGVGDGLTTFNLPDLRGYFVRGAGTNGDGTASGTFAAKQGHAYKNHAHTAASDTQGLHAHNSPGGGYSGNWVSGGSGQSPATQTSTLSDYQGSHAHTITVNTSTTGDATETRPANIAMLYCIKT